MLPPSSAHGALEGGRGLGVVAEREMAARDAHRQLGAQVEEVVEAPACRPAASALLEALEDRQRLGRLLVAEQVPGLLEVDDVGEVAVGIVAGAAPRALSCVASNWSCSSRLRAARYW